MKKPLFTFAEHDNRFPDDVKAQELAEYRAKLDPVALDLLSRLLSQGVPLETAPRLAFRAAAAYLYESQEVDFAFERYMDKVEAAEDLVRQTLGAVGRKPRNRPQRQ